MKKASLLFSLLLFISCSDSSESNNVITEVTESEKQSEEQIQENTETQEESNKNNKQSVEESNSRTVNEETITLNNLPDVKEFINNKSDRFIVDFEDIVAAHPYLQNHIMIYKSIFQILIQDG